MGVGAGGGEEERLLIELMEWMEEWGECWGEELSEGVLGYEEVESSVTVAVPALVCLVWTIVLEPADEGREEDGRGGSASH